MGEWVTNILATDRDKPPEENDGLLYTMAPLFLFESINAQISVAKSALETKLMYGVLVEIAGGLKLFQAQLIALIKGTDVY
jgi:hypothetical protein